MKNYHCFYYEIKKQHLSEDNKLVSSFFILEQGQDDISFVMLYNENIFKVKVSTITFTPDLSKDSYIETVSFQYENLAYRVSEIARNIIEKKFTGIVFEIYEINAIDDEDVRFPIYVDDECVPLEIVIYRCNMDLISLGTIKNIENFLIEKYKYYNWEDIEYEDYPDISVCSICGSVHLSERLHILEDDGYSFCDNCIDTNRVVECSCVHHRNKAYFIRKEDVEYEDEDGFCCRAYDDDGGIWFDNLDEEEDYYEDIMEY